MTNKGMHTKCSIIRKWSLQIFTSHARWYRGDLLFNMRHFRFQITLKSLLACVSLMAIACWFALPFRPTIEISELRIEEGSVYQHGAFTLSAKITNRGYGTVYVQSAGNSSSALSMSSLADLGSESEEYWLPLVETRWIRVNSLYEAPEITWRPVPSGESITIRNFFINSLPASRAKVLLTVVDWRGRTAMIDRNPFDLHAIPSHDKLTRKAQQEVAP